jgi:hypothetical protein
MGAVPAAKGLPETSVRLPVLPTAKAEIVPPEPKVSLVLLVPPVTLSCVLVFTTYTKEPFAVTLTPEGKYWTGK